MEIQADQLKVIEAPAQLAQGSIPLPRVNPSKPEETIRIGSHGCRDAIVFRAKVVVTGLERHNRGLHDAILIHCCQQLVDRLTLPKERLTEVRVRVEQRA
jgi:hypothetical protein